MENLSSMFATLGRSKIDEVLRMNQGRVEAAVDQLLALTTVQDINKQGARDTFPRIRLSSHCTQPRRSGPCRRRTCVLRANCARSKSGRGSSTSSATLASSAAWHSQYVHDASVYRPFTLHSSRHRRPRPAPRHRGSTQASIARGPSHCSTALVHRMDSSSFAKARRTRAPLCCHCVTTYAVPTLPAMTHHVPGRCRSPSHRARDQQILSVHNGIPQSG